jgi:hypothetical protein
MRISFRKIALVIPIIILLITGCNNLANSEVRSQKSEVRSQKSEVTVNQESNNIKNNTTLNCDDFELSSDEQILCEHWKNFNYFDNSINLEKFLKYDSTINNIRDLSPRDFAFSASTKITYKNKVYEANIYPNLRIELIDKNNTDSLNFICTSDSCASYFLWPFIDEGIADQKPHLANVPNTLLKKLYAKNYENYLNKMSKQSVKGKLAVKFYFENPNLDDSSYVIRYVDKASPLKNSIQEYLNSLTPEEKKLGFETSNFGNGSLQVKIEDKVALISFTADDLTRDLKSPQQVIDVTNSIAMTAEQFDTFNEEKICVNDTYNYQMAFFR